MKQAFTSGFFAGNRQRLRASLDEPLPIVVTANGLLQRNADTTFKFRQDSSFWYLTGINEPDIVLVMDGDKEYLILPGRDAIREAFDGAVTADMLIGQSGIREVLDEEHGWKRLESRLRKAKQFAALDAAPAYMDRYGLYANPARARLIERLRESKVTGELVDIRSKVAALRAIKQPVEIDAIRQAIAVTAESLEIVTAANQLVQYSYEYEAEADLAREFRRRGSHHAFEPIIAAGSRACQLHYMSNDGPLVSGELMIFDVGAEVDMYAADISRTVALGEPSRRQRQVFEAVREVQDYALTLLKPGTSSVDYEKEVEAAMGEKLCELGLIKTVNHEAVRKYYPHATSHFLGLDVHDVGDYRQPFADGMVLTCEPGIYIPEEGIGIRIEDDVLITADGHRVLSDRLPREL